MILLRDRIGREKENMRVDLISLFIKIVAFCAIVTMAPAAQESAVETCVLDDGSHAAAGQWEAAEAVCTSDSIHSKSGKPALHFHIPVDWKTGEPEYPIGWPRFNKHIQKEMQDWSGFDYLEFSVFTASSRTNLPDTPAGLNLYLPDRKHLYSRPLTELKIGQWTEFKIRFPMAKFRQIPTGRVGSVSCSQRAACPPPR